MQSKRTAPTSPDGPAGHSSDHLISSHEKKKKKGPPDPSSSSWRSPSPAPASARSRYSPTRTWRTAPSSGTWCSATSWWRCSGRRTTPGPPSRCAGTGPPCGTSGSGRGSGPCGQRAPCPRRCCCQERGKKMTGQGRMRRRPPPPWRPRRARSAGTGCSRSSTSLPASCARALYAGRGRPTA